MKRATRLAVAIVLMFSARATAEQAIDTQVAPAPAIPADVNATSSDLEPLFSEGASEWMVAGGPAFGVVVFHSAAGHRSLLQTLSFGRVLTRPRGPGPLRGRFAWVVEAAPVYGQFAPTRTYGFGFSPLVLRWNFTPRGRVAPYAELAGGALWTRSPVPARTTRANLTAHGAYGVRYFIRPQQALVVSYRFHHISNGNRLARNPGVNAHAFQFGFSFVRAQR